MRNIETIRKEITKVKQEMIAAEAKYDALMREYDEVIEAEYAAYKEIKG